jgi:hypothetical protein
MNMNDIEKLRRALAALKPFADAYPTADGRYLNPVRLIYSDGAKGSLAVEDFGDARDTYEALAATQEQPAEWQPIDSAPKDGREIEIRYLSDDPRRVRWSTSSHGTHWHLALATSAAIIRFEPTEWRAVSSSKSDAPAEKQS